MAHYFPGFTLHFRQFLEHCFRFQSPKTQYKQSGKKSLQLMCARADMFVCVLECAHSKCVCLFLFRRDGQGKTELIAN